MKDLEDHMKKTRKAKHIKKSYSSKQKVFESIKNLDPHTESPMYFNQREMQSEETKQGTETKKWLETAKSLDYSAIILIRFCLAKASEHALDTSMDWVELADQAELDENDIRIIRILEEESEIMGGIDFDAHKREKLKDRMNSLNGFVKLAASLSAELMHQLNVDNQNQNSNK